ncbi:MAG: hypothetical protein CSB48_08645 [Proteobacteria bacterium]|nr:MAG: hypothetical protein CSB48_08645 [Pseudomonadota bacterium]
MSEKQPDSAVQSDNSAPSGSDSQPKPTGIAILKIIKWALVSVIGLLLIVLLAVWLIGGKVTVSYLDDYLQESNQVSISPQSELTFNPFLSRLTIRNLELLKQEKTVLFVKELQLSYLLPDLFTKTVVFDEAFVDNLFIHANMLENQVAGISLETEDSPEEAPDEEDSGPMEWKVSLPKFTLTDTRFEAITEGRSDVIGIDLFELKDLHFKAEQLDLQMLLRASINEAPVRFALDVNIQEPLVPEALAANATGSYQIKEFDTADYSSLLPDDIQTLLGQIHLEGDIAANYNNQAMQLRQSGNRLTIRNGGLVLAGLDVKTGSITLALSDLDVQVKQNANPEAPSQISISLDPHLTASGLALTHQALADPEAATTGETATRDKAPETGHVASQATELNLQLIDFNPGKVTVQTQQNSLNVTTDNTTLQLNGLALNSLPVIIESASQKLDIASFSLEQKQEHMTLALSPALESGSTQIYLHHNKNLAASWEAGSLAPGEISLKDDQPEITIPLVSFSQFQASRPAREDLPRPIAQTEQLAITNLHLLDNHLAIDKINLEKMITEVILTTEREIHNLIDLEAQQTETTESTADQTKATEEKIARVEEPENGEESTPFTFSLGQIIISPDSRIKFVDRQAKPHFEQELELTHTRFGPIDTRNPDTKSNLLLDAKVGDYGQLKASGYVKPFTETTNMKLKGKIREFALTPLSFYTREALENDIESGQLNTEFDVKVVDNILKGDAKVLLQSLELVSLNPEKSAKVDGGAISLNMAVGLLTDSNGNIELDVPMRGNVNSPTFGLGTFLTIIMKKAMMIAAQEVILQSLVPYAGVASIAMEVGSEMMKVKFAPLPYQVKQVIPDETQSDYLNKFTEVMKKNKAIQIRMCAITVPGDIDIQPGADIKLTEAQVKALLDLGLQREKELKSLLINKGLESSRLLECKPKINKDPKATPGIELKS